ncbi:MAG: ABC transporter permease [Planctomycetaceae bacterium]
MQIRTAAFLVRSLRQESRLVSHHVMRAALAALVIFLFAMEAMSMSIRTGGGGIFASTVLLCVYWFLTLVGGIYFSMTIVEEKEEETLPLLRMTGASTFSILIGKSLPRLAVAILFLLVIAPFLLLAITLGGVLPFGLTSAILGVLVYSVMLCQLGVFASVVARDAPRAFSLTVILWMLLEFSGTWAWLLAEMIRALGGLTYNTDVVSYLQSHTWSDNWGTMLCAWSHLRLANLSEWLAARTMIGNLSSMLTAFESTEIWHDQMTFQLCAAVFFFLMSWVTFDFFTGRAVGEGAAAAAPQRSKSARRSPRRVQGQALAWKSWQYQTGGRLWFLMRLVGYPLLLLVLYTGIIIAVDEQFDAEGLGITWIYGGFIMIIVNTARLLGMVLNSEVYGKTLNSLLMLPKSSSEVLWPMILGLFPALLAATSAFFLGLFVVALDNIGNWNDVGEMLGEPWFYMFFVWVLTTAHVGLLLSVYTRYGGMMIAIAVMWIVTPMVFFSMIGVLAAVTSAGSWFGDFLEKVVPLLLIPASLTACVVIEHLIARRVEALGAQS